MGCCLLACLFAVGQSAEKPRAPATKAPVLDSRQKRGYELLESARASVEGASYDVRVYLELQLANGYQGFNPGLSQRLLKRAFSDTLGIADENEKIHMQSEALLSLLRFGPHALDPLLPKAEPAAREEPVRRILGTYVANGRYDEAVKMLLEQANAFQEFPYDLATPLMLHLPGSKAADRQMLFSLALASYREHSHKQLTVGGEDFTRMVVRFWEELPPQLVLEAIDEILKQAKDAQSGSISFSSPKGSAAFSSLYEARMFEFVPIIRDLDSSLADRLLNDDAALESSLEQYPNGLVSLDPTLRNTPLAKGESSALGESVQLDSQGAPSEATSSSTAALNFETNARQIAEESRETGLDSISKALNLPVQVGALYPRADAMEGIARANFAKSPSLAGRALKELNKATEDIDPLQRADYLFSENDILLLMGDQLGAADNLKVIAKVAEQVYKDDSDPDDPNTAPKPYWPSAAVWGRMLPIALKRSDSEAASVVASIHDPEMQMIETVALADLYLGAPTGVSLIAVKKKNRQSISSSSPRPN